MQNQNEQFKNQGYALLKGFFDKAKCDQLVVGMRDWISKGRTVKDDQCPLSQAFSGTPFLDALLEQMQPYCEGASGKKLYPTYSYGRLYTAGDELKIHTDREACEISLTITLGFEGQVWPIYMADYADPGQGREIKDFGGGPRWINNEAEIRMDVGDAVMYQGRKKVHWRRPYTEGRWQAQVFLHYVDANGPYADWKYDKRAGLANHRPA